MTIFAQYSSYNHNWVDELKSVFLRCPRWKSSKVTREDYEQLIQTYAREDGSGSQPFCHGRSRRSGQYCGSIESFVESFAQAFASNLKCWTWSIFCRTRCSLSIVSSHFPADEACSAMEIFAQMWTRLDLFLVWGKPLTLISYHMRLCTA